MAVFDDFDASHALLHGAIHLVAMLERCFVREQHMFIGDGDDIIVESACVDCLAALLDVKLPRRRQTMAPGDGFPLLPQGRL